jgi:hypothetical protein
MIYTAWGYNNVANTLIPGDQQPCFLDGTPDLDATELIWTIEANSWSEACRKYHELQGWEAYTEESNGN